MSEKKRATNAAPDFKKMIRRLGLPKQMPALIPEHVCFKKSNWPKLYQYGFCGDWFGFSFAAQKPASGEVPDWTDRFSYNSGMAMLCSEILVRMEKCIKACNLNDDVYLMPYEISLYQEKELVAETLTQDVYMDDDRIARLEILLEKPLHPEAKDEKTKNPFYGYQLVPEIWLRSQGLNHACSLQSQKILPLEAQHYLGDMDRYQLEFFTELTQSRTESEIVALKRAKGAPDMTGPDQIQERRSYLRELRKFERRLDGMSVRELLNVQPLGNDLYRHALILEDFTYAADKMLPWSQDVVALDQMMVNFVGILEMHKAWRPKIEAARLRCVG